MQHLVIIWMHFHTSKSFIIVYSRDTKEKLDHKVTKDHEVPRYVLQLFDFVEIRPCEVCLGHTCTVSMSKKPTLRLSTFSAKERTLSIEEQFLHTVPS